MARLSNVVTIAATVVLLGAAMLSAQDEKAKAPASSAPPAKPAATADQGGKPVSANSGLEKMKSLAGEWFTADVPAGDQSEKQDAAGPVCVYRVVAAGSAVQETLFPGTPHEMVTMYHVDGTDLVLTHYCSLGNQPHMQAEPPKDPKQLVFKFAGGSNIDPGKDDHMHDLTITFVEANHIQAEWTMFSKGQKEHSKTFDLKRKSK
jgi:hypothetical protein